MDAFVCCTDPTALLEPHHGRYFVQDIFDPEDLSSHDIQSLLQESTHRLREEGLLALPRHENFDTLFLMTKSLDQMPDYVRSDLASVLATLIHLVPHCFEDIASELRSLSTEEFENGEAADLLGQLSMARVAFKMVVALSSWYVIRSISHSEGKTQRGSTPSTWDMDVEKVFEALASTFSCIQPEWFSNGRMDDDLWSLLLSSIFALFSLPGAASGASSSSLRMVLDEENNTKVPVQSIHSSSSSAAARSRRQYIGVMFPFICKNQPTDSLDAIASAVLAASMRSEEIPSCCAEMCHTLHLQLAKSENVTSKRFFASLFQCISSLEADDLGKDVGAAKNLSCLIAELADRVPALVGPNLPFIMHLLDCDIYQLRNALIHTIGSLIAFRRGSGLPEDKNIDSTKGDDAEGDSDLATEKSSNTLLSVLFERLLDSSAYVRSRTLQEWINLVEKRCVPLDSIVELTRAVVRRVVDKSSIVRKWALVLLCRILETNPFGPCLESSLFRERLEGLKSHLEAYIKEKASKSDEIKKETSSSQEELDSAENEIPIISPKPSVPSSAEEQFSEFLEDIVDEIDEDSKLFQLVDFFTMSLQFIAEIENSLSSVLQLLGSKTVTDVQSAIDFVVLCNHFRVHGASGGSRKMLTLVFSRENGIKTAALESFHSLYLAQGSKDPNLCCSLLGLLLQGASVAEITCMEEALSLLIADGRVHGLIITTLWDRFFSTQIPREHSNAALILLTMITRSRPQSIVNKMPDILKFGLSESSFDDMQRIRNACLLLKRAGTIQAGANGSPLRLSNDHPAIRALCRILTVPDVCRSVSWVAAGDQAVDALFSLSENPVAVSNEVLVELRNQIPSGDFRSDAVISDDRRPVLLRLIFLVGHFALKQMVFLDEEHSQLKRKMMGVETPNTTFQTDDGDGASSSNSRSTKLSSKRTKKRGKKQSEDEENQSENTAISSSIEAELGFDSTLVAEHEADLKCEQAIRDIVEGNGLIASLIRFISNFCISLHRIDPELQRVAVLSLCKLMTLSPNICDDGMRILFTLLEQSPSPSIRGNIIVSLGDLAFRFPNIAEPYTDRLFRRLRDPHPGVRKQAIMVLSHLILNDMIKARARLSDIALLLEDPEIQIRDLSKLFFQEFAQKGSHVIYNEIPDIISNFSQSESVSTESFQSVIKYLFEFISKERHAESLFEKISHRFGSSMDSKTHVNLAFCLNQLPVSERSVKKLVENFKFYKGALYDKKCAEEFESLLMKCRKISKLDEKPILREFESLIMGTLEQNGLRSQVDSDPPSVKSVKDRLNDTSEDDISVRLEHLDVTDDDVSS